jgi:PTS system cellobiose-specific IIC component
MNSFIKWLENNFAPKMLKINNSVWVGTLRDAIMQVLPLIFLGSLFCLLTIPGDFFHIKHYPNFWTPFGWTMGMISLMISFLVPFNLMERKKLRKQRIIGGMTGIITFLIIITPQVVADKTVGFGDATLGTAGMFVAIIAGLISGMVMMFFGKFSFFKQDSAIPDFVRAWFDSMLPIGLVVVAAWVVVDIGHVDVYHTIKSVFDPIGKVFETPWGFSLVMFLLCFVYSMGISTWALDPIYRPVFLAAITANIAGAHNIVTNETVYCTYLWIGGIGATLPLVIMLSLSKVSRLKAIGRASLIPGLFNINEPVVFGAIAWNPFLMIPMWINGLVLPLIVWFGEKTFAPIPKIVFDLWYIPFPISTWMVTQSFVAIILTLIVAAAATLIWFPFFKAYEKQELEKEKETVA